MVRYAQMLAPRKMSDLKVAKAVYQLASGRFQIKLYSIAPWRFYKLEPSCIIWNHDIQPPLKVCFVLISMLYLTERFEEIKLYATNIRQGIFNRPHYYIRLRVGNTRYDLDPLVYHTTAEFGVHLGPDGSETDVPSIQHLCNRHLSIGDRQFHVCD